MDRFHFSGLPESCRVGPAALRPISTLGDPLQKCCVCKKVSVDYHACPSKHGYCPDCFPPFDRTRAWCVGCAACVEFTAGRLPPKVIENAVFSCPCSFTGSLSQIRDHLFSTRNPEICFSQPAAEDKHRSEEAPQTRETLDRFIQDFHQTQISLRRHETIIPLLAEGLSTVEMICDMLSGNRKILRFDLQKLARKEVIVQHKLVNGVPLKIQAEVQGLEDEPFLCVSVAGSDIQTVKLRRPLQKRISLRIMDMRHQPVVAYDILTFENGEYADATFIDPTLDPSSSGVSFFVAMDDVIRTYRKDGMQYMFISVAVEDIQV